MIIPISMTARANVSALIDSSQNLAASYRYDVFGKLLKKTGTLSQPFMFSTKQYDEPMGHYNFGYRFYSPSVGKWMIRDPLTEAGGINLYQITDNNPVNFVDPYGLFNPTKAFSSMINSANAGRLYASGILKYASAAGISTTGVGTPAGTGIALLGTWNLYSASAAQKRAIQQWNEALEEPWANATSRNFLGVLPFGQKFDDPCEPMPGEFLREQYNRVKDKPSEIWKLLGEYGTLLF